ncbi:MAG: hypothetical protein A2487_04460 [Candidatus Raymondbacteria bacterium RifOxyC12_full_50_8]|uniref:HTH cro/C1-type domain-containing protein n=1 Tax=Candidatus Raymondbacteria bacterium RIFOXYD12_FULL_49_13 TaxID=1817890 RepID=A0A1F7F095_UNCRA|nr:MAG: hypothetical protein A2350_10920 [Candidatus Raymondbacteria bacterium RifOxyB12_full_50_8]OGJ93390.1 MAG: hypothetical protein A2248_21620 [Candidatus Raymondbacteria bacterium RIFOXYA2_FULL_49_16]OGJ98491.1 MAG: hypothetical protein A2487_04460 [Candidatus Raymondbacteria bacterium RifOxyC12_full_50_8]OGK00038.1 MAG: hypothetical protein A2519_22175 [Candidatus Raymondbacteria bacterium RIFOXYD12_FULL_49_13]OGP45027.1 MAG: hypothetical protein A2324_13500 [Candidatus Raymondbacteria b
MNTYNFEILRFLRKQKKLTIEGLAKKSKVSFAVISKLERNQTNPGLATLQQMARALDMSATELVSMAEVTANELKKETSYKANGFFFRRVQYNNLTLQAGSAPAKTKISRPEIHENDNEIVYVSRGSVRLTLPMGAYVINKGESMQFDAIFSHTYEVLQDCDLIIVHIKKDKRF